MNERIKLFAELAINAIPAHLGSRVPIEFTEKFAELIVKECAHIAWLYDDPKLYWHGAVIAKSIKHRFGVE